MTVKTTYIKWNRLFKHTRTIKLNTLLFAICFHTFIYLKMMAIAAPKIYSYSIIVEQHIPVVFLCASLSPCFPGLVQQPKVESIHPYTHQVLLVWAPSSNWCMQTHLCAPHKPSHSHEMPYHRTVQCSQLALHCNRGKTQPVEETTLSFLLE